jgi:alpha-amylase/alpha-mannosidase (GH57 family)
VRYVIVHGHFYQPPRENPWTERLGQEASAHPYHDWNERIRRECYAPNRAARILDAEKRITAIINNYERMSFNFGPTLLDWMARCDRVTLDALVAADRASRERLGFGNAMAQAYNHAILPLIDRTDKVTQVRWGLAHFRHFFGREAEGMWLPETAADAETLDVLAEEGVRFTVLAPWQLTALRSGSGAPWREEIRPDDLGRPYRFVTPGGREIVLFFYDGEVAREVAFERLLESGDAFASRLAAGAQARPAEAPLLHMATDGETYGHHHRFGEMALAYALRRLEEDPETEVTNYAAFLRRFPPTWEARLLEPGSWSCVHGVERWRADCGCSTGGEPGFNQKWRAPLFYALTELRRCLGDVYEREGGKVLVDPWAARDAYIDVLLDPAPQTRSGFLAAHRRGSAPAAEIWRLLEMERHALLMFTSCGWFFSDLAGIETLQVLRYAARGIELCGEDLPQDVGRRIFRILEGAMTNGKPVRTGAALLREVVRRSRVDPARVGAEAVLAKRLGLGHGEVPSPPAFAVTVRALPGNSEGTVEVMHRRTEERSAYYYVIEMDGSPRLAVRLQPAGPRGVLDASGAGELVVGVEDVDPEAAQLVADRFLERLERKTVLRLKDILKHRVGVIRFLEQRRIRPPRALARLVEVVWMEDLLRELKLPPEAAEASGWVERLGRFSALGLARNDEQLASVLAVRLLLDTQWLCREGSERAGRNLLEGLRVAKMLEPSPDLWDAQNVFYACARGTGPHSAAPTQGARPVPAVMLREAAEQLGFDPSVLTGSGRSSERSGDRGLGIEHEERGGA